MLPKKLFVGADHGGFSLKAKLCERVAKKYPGLVCVDLGPASADSVHYPDFAQKVAELVGQGEGEGLLICGSGIGMSIAANKVNGVRAALVWDVTSARLAREHNNANILCLGARLLGEEVAAQALDAWLDATFQGGRHQERIDLIARMEKR